MKKYVLAFALVSCLAAPCLSVCVSNLCRCSQVWVLSQSSCSISYPNYCTIGWFAPNGTNRLPSNLQNVDVYAVDSSKCSQSCLATPSVGTTTATLEEWIFSENYPTECAGDPFDPSPKNNQPPSGGNEN